MHWSRLVISLGPTFHDHGELELLVAGDGDSVSQLSSPTVRLSVQVPSELAVSLVLRARAYLLTAATEELQGRRDGIHGRLLLESEGREAVEVEYWSPIPSDASYKLINETLNLVSPLFSSSGASSYLEIIRSYLGMEHGRSTSGDA